MKINGSLLINAPSETTFSVFSDINNAERYLSGVSDIEILSKKKSGKGLKWRETRTMFGKESSEEMQIVAFQKNKMYQVAAESHGVRYLTTFTFTSVGEGTKVDMQFSGKPQTLAARLLGTVGVLFKSSTKKALMQDMHDLKTVAEAKAKK